MKLFGYEIKRISDPKTITFITRDDGVQTYELSGAWGYTEGLDTIAALDEISIEIFGLLKPYDLSVQNINDITKGMIKYIYKDYCEIK